MVNHCCFCSKSAPIAQSFGLCEKFYRFLKKNFLDLFVGSKKCITFALAFGKQRGNAG